MNNYLKMMRLDHWHKNLFIVPGVLAGWKYFELDLHSADVYMKGLLALLVTSLASSVNYIVNELLDAKYDKFHPIKQNRPAAMDNVKSGPAIALLLLLLVVVFVLSLLFMHNTFTVVIVIFLFSGMVYNVPPVRMKDVAFFDVIVESFNNPLRLSLGWFCYTNAVMPPSSALIAYWCLAGFMMTAKRLAEYSVFDEDHTREKYRKSFKVYSKSRLINFICFWISLFSLMFGIFVIRININSIIIFPFIAVFFAWYMKLAFEKDSVVKDPERMFKRPVFFFYSLGVFSLFVVILFLGENITFLDWIRQSNGFIELQF